MDLLIITPFKNEQDSILRTMESIVMQSEHPVKWLMMDDGSDNFSPKLVKQYQKLYHFIHYHRRKSPKGPRATGNNIVDLFNEGLQLAAKLKIKWDIVAKLDADLVIQRSDYLAFMMDKFTRYPTLGIASGVTFILDKGKKVIESTHRWHTQGPNKFYRKACLEDIGDSNLSKDGMGLMIYWRVTKTTSPKSFLNRKSSISIQPRQDPQREG